MKKMRKNEYGIDEVVHKPIFKSGVAILLQKANLIKWCDEAAFFSIILITESYLTFLSYKKLF